MAKNFWGPRPQVQKLLDCFKVGSDELDGLPFCPDLLIHR
jgi:hypothetical protein